LGYSVEVEDAPPLHFFPCGVVSKVKNFNRKGRKVFSKARKWLE